ncbi:hypothetical protein [Oceanibaculum indicum]|uniref:Uncharacterized protein n=1 Tax=Oceanibaculum indicum TaxID=526216 RepID=A0A420WGT0_9PROT|nr:hypothetical protein [Oceanibaculum indicum]RKQ70145.1 hypothetical protein BCL74_2085 [Oceanibaculum indicum]
MTGAVPARAGRRFTRHFEANPSEVIGLRPDHHAVRLGRTIFPRSVVAADEAPRLLVSGANQRKLGDRVTAGPWKGMPIYALTLEERATCPVSCHHWHDCYGNSMPFARRHREGAALEARLMDEVTALSCAHPRGFVIRLHLLGDFYSLDYVRLWAALMKTHRALHVFGYTAWPVGTPIGNELFGMARRNWQRFAIRRSVTSDRAEGRTAVTITDPADLPAGAILCPAQKADGVPGALPCCGACGACWHPAARHRPIAFLLHGMKRGNRGRKPRTPSAIPDTPALTSAANSRAAA